MRGERPGTRKACETWVRACLSCQQVKDPRKQRFLLQSIESSDVTFARKIQSFACFSPSLPSQYFSVVFSNIGSTKTLLFSGFDQNAQIN